MSILPDQAPAGLQKNHYCIKNHDQYNTDKNDT